ncbi:MAG: transporter, partial [Gammaproteobacteria bacterium]|nr:transporter [Gammaproteobacteria bacterium]
AVVLKQENGWTYGALANHIWSVAGDDSRADVNATFLQPFISYTTKTYTTFSLNTESTYDWDAEQWTVPINAMASQLVKFGTQPVSFAVGYRNYVEAPAGGPDWGVRFVVTFLFPK